MEMQMAKKRPQTTESSTMSAAGNDDMPQTKTGAAKKFLRENPDLVENHTYKELAEMIAKKYGFAPTTGDVANAKALIMKGRSGSGPKRRPVSASAPRLALSTPAAPAAPTAPAVKAVAASASAANAVSATLDLVRAVGLEQASAIISGLSKSN
jgi:hypothetical protein